MNSRIYDDGQETLKWQRKILSLKFRKIGQKNCILFTVSSREPFDTDPNEEHYTTVVVDM